MLTRRRMMIGAAGLVALGTLGHELRAADRRHRACVIGSTGKGDYGHGLDLIFADLPGVEVVAVADHDAEGRERARQRCRAQRAYVDYHEMLEKEKPSLVSIAPRWTEEHHAMALAALGAGAHLVMEKPITTTPREADEVLALAEKSKRRIAVAHQMRLAPAVVALARDVKQGMIGELLELRAWGKQDTRAGGEDMMVLGTHMFDLMRMFGGDVEWCTASVRANGKEIEKGDARKAGENIGPVAGSHIQAQFDFTRGIIGTFTSRAAMRERTGHWGLELVGSKTSARILADIHPRVFVLQEGKWSDIGRDAKWVRWEKDDDVPPEQRSTAAANRRVAEDWLAAIEEQREPACSGHNAAKALEMVMAVYRASLGRTRVNLPLAERGHPLM